MQETGQTPKQILFVLSALDMSGASFSVLNLIAGFKQLGRKIMVLAKAGGEREQSFRATGADVVIAKHFGLPILGHGALHKADAFQPDIIHAFSFDQLTRCHRLARDLNVPLVVTANRIEDQNTKQLHAYDQIGVIALSEAIQERLTNQDQIVRDRIEVIPGGLDLSTMPQRNLQSTIRRSTASIIGTYGTFSKRKGQRVFVQAASKVLKAGFDVEFLLMGQGPDKPKLRELGQELGISRRLTFSPSTASDLDNLCNIDIFVEPTHQEGFGLSALQAMATGVPVIACGVGGLYGLIEDGKTGLLVPAGNEDALAEAMIRLLQSDADREDFAHAALEKVQREFSAKVVCQRLLNYYMTRVTPSA